MRPRPESSNSAALAVDPAGIPETETLAAEEGRKGPVLLVGFPNVGKSSIFNLLTGSYVTVSNYPGTTVGVSFGHLRIPAGEEVLRLEVSDPPGMYGLLPLTDEERVAREALFSSRPSCVLHIVDSKTLPRQLGLTLRLIQAGLPLILVCNMTDEAETQGYRLDTGVLAERLGIPVVKTCGTNGVGLHELKHEIAAVVRGNGRPAGHRRRIPFDEGVMGVLDEMEARIEERRREARTFLPAGMDSRTAAQLALEGATDIAAASGLDSETLGAYARKARDMVGHPFPLYAPLSLKAVTDKILEGVFEDPERSRNSVREALSRMLINPWSGIPILLAVLYLCFYQFVGVFGAGTVVGWLEDDLFGRFVNPFFQRVAEGALPWPWLQKLFVGDYGVFTLGITYAVALVMPVVFFFFLSFSLLEDSGYFPRLALLVDRFFKRIGLNGRAVIPMVLGFGCDTMATITTRTLETGKERILATLLLALAIPCSAQLGIIMALLGSRGFGVWVGYVLVLTGIVFFVGWAGSKVLPGRAATFHMELPPLRLPRLSNVLVKSFARMRWYFFEVIPLFLLASVVLWALDLSGGLVLLRHGLEPVMMLLGLPVEAADSFLIGFFRRDFGAAGLFHLAQYSPDKAGLSTHQLFVASVTLTLFVPCIAQFMMMFKERGSKVAASSALAITGIAILTGFGLHHFLLLTGWL